MTRALAERCSQFTVKYASERQSFHLSSQKEMKLMLTEHAEGDALSSSSWEDGGQAGEGLQTAVTSPHGFGRGQGHDL